jgi:hypothetical protein
MTMSKSLNLAVNVLKPFSSEIFLTLFMFIQPTYSAGKKA